MPAPPAPKRRRGSGPRGPYPGESRTATTAPGGCSTGDGTTTPPSSGGTGKPSRAGADALPENPGARPAATPPDEPTAPPSPLPESSGAEADAGTSEEDENASRPSRGPPNAVVPAAFCAVRRSRSVELPEASLPLSMNTTERVPPAAVPEVSVPQPGCPATATSPFVEPAVSDASVSEPAAGASEG